MVHAHTDRWWQRLTPTDVESDVAARRAIAAVLTVLDSVHRAEDDCSFFDVGTALAASTAGRRKTSS